MKLRMYALVLTVTLPLFAGQAQSPGALPQASVTPTTGTTASLSKQQIARFLRLENDWAGLHRYRAEDSVLPVPLPGQQRVVFLGDSITDGWGRRHGKFFPGKPYLNRGISGQTTPQMLVRFQQDVLALHPAVVVILAGTNDIAQNTGPEPMSAIEDDFRSMVTLAKAAHIRVVLSSVLPATHYPWRPEIQPAGQIRQLNQWLKEFCAEQGLVYLDYYPSLVNNEGGMQAKLAADGYVHPNDAGYAVMEPLAEAAISKAMASPAP